MAGKKILSGLLTACMLMAAATGCGSNQTATGNEPAAETGSHEESSFQTEAAAGGSGLAAEEMFTGRDREIGYDESASVKITLADDASSASGHGVVIEENMITIQEEGTYIISGRLSDGQIIVDDGIKEKKIQLVLHGAEISNSSSAAIYVRAADKVFITTAAGTENTITVPGEFIAIDDNKIDAAIFSKDDLTLNGAGVLTVECSYGHGVVGKDDLVISSGTCHISAASHAVSGKNSIRIAGGTLHLTAGKDGLHSENNDDESLGFIYVAGGDIQIQADGDGMDAQTILQLDGASVRITAGGGFAAGTSATADGASAKGLKAGQELLVNDGEFKLDTADDALHSNGSVAIYGGTLTISAGDDGIHGDGSVAIYGGVVTVAESYEGVEGQSIDIYGGIIDVTAGDDGFNASGGADGSGTIGGRDQFQVDENCNINISGGSVTINASGDGIDSNGSLIISGGSVIVHGPTRDGDGAIDYNGTAAITGGTLLAIGSSGMTQGFGSDSTQASILYMLDETATAGSVITLKDINSSILAELTAVKEFHTVQLSTPELVSGNTYILGVDNTEYEIELTEITYSNGSNDETGFGGRGGHQPPDGDMNGEPPKRPTGEAGGESGAGENWPGGGRKPEAGNNSTQ